MKTSEIEALAQAEFAQEQRRERVEQYKMQLRKRAGRPWFTRWCPWTVEVRKEACLRHIRVFDEVVVFEGERIQSITLRRIPA